MARAGTKRKWKGTSPGRLNVRRVSDDELAAQWPHRAGLPAALRLSAKATTVLGRLNINGHVSDEQYEAGQQYSGIVHNYAASIDAPMDIKNGSGKGYLCLGDRYCEPCECRARKDRYDKAFGAVNSISQRAAQAVAHVAVHDRPHEDMHMLRMGLSALADHFGLTTSRNRNRR